MGLVFMGQVFSGCCMNLLFSRQNQKTKSLLCFPMDFFADLVFKGQGLYSCIQKYIEVFSCQAYLLYNLEWKQLQKLQSKEIFLRPSSLSFQTNTNGRKVQTFLSSDTTKKGFSGPPFLTSVSIYNFLRHGRSFLFEYVFILNQQPACFLGSSELTDTPKGIVPLNQNQIR